MSDAKPKYNWHHRSTSNVKNSNASSNSKIAKPKNTSSKISGSHPNNKSDSTHHKKKLSKLALALIIVSVVIVVIVVVVLAVTLTATSTSANGSGNVFAPPTRTIFFTGGVVSGSTQIPANIQGDFTDLFFAAVPWSLTTFPNSFFFACVNNSVSTPFYQLNWTTFQTIPPNPVGNGQLTVSGNPVTASSTGVQIGFFGAALNPSTTVKLDPQIPFCGTFQFTPTSTTQGTVQITFPGQIPANYQNHLVFAQNTTGANQNLLTFTGGTVTSSSTAELAYSYLGGASQTNPGSFGYMIVAPQATLSTGTVVVYAAQKTYNGTTSGLRTENNLLTGINLPNTLGSFVWAAFGNDTSSSTVVQAVQQTSPTTISMILNGPQVFTVNLFCFFGITSSSNPNFSFV